jgi:hypothetical protein
VKGDESAPLPYEGVSSLLVIADSANNRYVVCDAEQNKFIEQIGSGRIGYQNGSFKDAQFYHT